MLRLAKVVAVHPEDNSVDLILLDDAARAAGVQVLSGFAGTDFGSSGMTIPDLSDPSDRWALRDSGTRDVLAVVSGLGGGLVVLGFLFPQVNQVLFDRPNFMVHRHPSDLYTSIDKDGNLEVSHPSGTYFKIGVDPEHEDLTSKDFDKKWKISKNKGKAVNVRVQVANAGSVTATANIAPSGDVTLDTRGSVTVTCDGNASVDSKASVMAKAAADIAMEAGGSVSVNAGGSISFSAGGALNFSGATVDFN